MGRPKRRPEQAYDEVTARRFWVKVDKRGSDECWPWLASRTQRGYGRFNLGPKSCSAHRVAYELTYGPLPADIEACHRCDNPPCCNPGHLFPGTHATNMADLAAKGRHWKYTKTDRFARGERQGRAILTAEMAQTIVTLHQNGQTKRGIARQLFLNRSTVCDVLAGRTWQHITRIKEEDAHEPS